MTNSANALYSETPVEWKISTSLVDYDTAVSEMEVRAARIAAGAAPELVWVLQHAPLYTAGTSAKLSDLLTPDRFPVYKSGRGGQYTYHGPGQLVAYFMLDLKTRGRDIKAFVCGLEGLIINTLARHDIDAGRREGRVGVWVTQPNGREEKIAALGIRIRKWVSFHGISININPDLDHFSGIIPCGLAEHGVTSLEAMGNSAGVEKIETVLQDEFQKSFAPLITD